MLAPFSAKMEGGYGVPPSFLLRWLFLPTFSPLGSHFGAMLPPFGRLWAPSGLDLGGVLSHFGAKLALSSGTWAQELRWMGWWGYAKRSEFNEKLGTIT